MSANPKDASKLLAFYTWWWDEANKPEPIDGVTRQGLCWNAASWPAFRPLKQDLQEYAKKLPRIYDRDAADTTPFNRVMFGSIHVGMSYHQEARARVMHKNKHRRDFVQARIKELSAIVDSSEEV